MTKKAWFEDAMPSMKSNPTTDSTPSTPGIGEMMLSTRSATACVRLTEAPCGSGHGGEEGALVLLRQEALRRGAEQPERGGDDADHHDDADDRDPHQPAHDGDIAVAHVSMAPST